MAHDLYSSFHWGKKPDKTVHIPIPEPSANMTELGTLESITYGTVKKGEPPTLWEHAFGEEDGKQPMLAVDPADKQLYILGGNYRIEEEGIIN